MDLFIHFSRDDGISVALRTERVTGVVETHEMHDQEPWRSSVPKGLLRALGMDAVGFLRRMDVVVETRQAGVGLDHVQPRSKYLHVVANEAGADPQLWLASRFGLSVIGFPQFSNRSR